MLLVLIYEYPCRTLVQSQTEVAPWQGQLACDLRSNPLRLFNLSVRSMAWGIDCQTAIWPGHRTHGTDVTCDGDPGSRCPRQKH